MLINSNTHRKIKYCGKNKDKRSQIPCEQQQYRQLTKQVQPHSQLYMTGLPTYI
jgi:hypothetical protein